MPRRGMNIYKRKDGRWEGRIRREGFGEEKGKYDSIYGKSYSEVKRKMEQARANRATGGDRRGITVADAMDVWFADQSPHWKPTTCATYAQMVRKHILPGLGAMSVMQIDNQTMEAFAAGIRAGEDGEPLSSGYVRGVCSLVLRALGYVKRKYRCGWELPDNPIRQNRKRRLSLPPEGDMARLERYLLRNVRDDTCLGILIAFYTGIRLGELSALTWDDIRLDEEVICIRRNLQRVKDNEKSGEGTKIVVQTPKTDTSQRMIPIPPVLLPLLKRRGGESGQYVVRGGRKSWAEPRTIQYRFAKILESCGIEHFHFHMLRHAFATRCVAEGFDVKSLSEILGHSNVQITLNLYVHSTMQHKRELMQAFNFCYYQSRLEQDLPERSRLELTAFD